MARIYASDTKRIVTAFVEGINAYVELTRRGPDLLPFEFGLLDYEPALWTPEMVVRIRSHGLLWNASQEAARARFVRNHGLAALRFREILSPPHEVSVPDGLDLAAIPDGVLDVYYRARGGVRFAHGCLGRISPIPCLHCSRKATGHGRTSGPAARGGSGATVNSTAYSLDDFVQRYGASFRMLLDVGNWDDSVAMNTPGQSGDPSSTHDRDLFEAWARDQSIPLLYSRERVEAETERRILLRSAARRPVPMVEPKTP